MGGGTHAARPRGLNFGRNDICMYASLAFVSRGKNNGKMMFHKSCLASTFEFEGMGVQMIPMGKKRNPTTLSRNLVLTVFLHALYYI